MNHTVTVHSIAAQTNASSHISAYLSSAYNTSIPYILGETNSLYNEGKPGLSNSFGAALWGVDFNLYCASVGIQRVHMHQGTDYRYASWQPIETNKTSKGTKAPYYGNIAVANMLGNLLHGKVQIVNLPLEDEFESAYAAYVDGMLKRIAVLNMHQYNYTVNGTSDILNPVPRPSRSYAFNVPSYCGEEVEVKRLMANGSDAISGITWDGTSYNWELDNGKPVRLQNVTRGETMSVGSGVVSVVVEDSSCAILSFGGR